MFFSLVCVKAHLPLFRTLLQEKCGTINDHGWNLSLSGFNPRALPKESQSPERRLTQHHLKDLLKHRLLGPAPNLGFGRSGGGSANLHFSEAQTVERVLTTPGSEHFPESHRTRTREEGISTEIPEEFRHRGPLSPAATFGLVIPHLPFESLCYFVETTGGHDWIRVSNTYIANYVQGAALSSLHVLTHLVFTTNGRLVQLLTPISWGN